MTDKEEIIQEILKTIKASKAPRGALWYLVMVKVRDELKISTEQVNQGVLEAIDQRLIIDDQMGWLKVKVDVAEHIRDDAP